MIKPGDATASTLFPSLMSSTSLAPAELVSSAEHYLHGYKQQVWIDAYFMALVYAIYGGFLIIILFWSKYKAFHSFQYEQTNSVKDRTRLLLNDNADEMLQQGFYTPLIGSILYYSTIVLSALSQILIFIILISDQVITAKEAYMYWEPKANALIMAWFLSAFCSLGLRFSWVNVQTLFMLRASLSDCTHAVIWRRNDDESEEDESDALSHFIISWRDYFSYKFGAIQPGYSRFIILIQTIPATGVRYFDLMCTRYVYCKDLGDFRSTGGCLVMSVRDAVSAVDHGGLGAATVATKIDDYGQNKINVDMSPLYCSIGRVICGPVVIFQMLCIYLMLFNQNTISALLWTFMSLYGITVKALLVRKNQLRVTEKVESVSLQKVQALREGKLREVLAANLVPGDVIEIMDNCEIVCDMVLVKGQVVVNEANLTGDAIPIQKFALPLSDGILDPEQTSTRKHMLYAGTKVITNMGVGQRQSTSGVQSGERFAVDNGNTNEFVQNSICVVIRTGATTVKGNLIKDVLFPNELRFSYMDQIQLVTIIMVFYALTLFLLLASVIGYSPATFFYGLATVSQLSPVWLFVLLTVGQNAAAYRLSSNRIYSLSPVRIAICGKIRIMSFDKTGTLTKSSMSFVGIQPTRTVKFRGGGTADQYDGTVRCYNSEAIFEGYNEKVHGRQENSESNDVSIGIENCVDCTERLPSLEVTKAVMQGIACCHSLSAVERVGKQVLMGSDLERKMFLSTGWKISGNTIRPTKASDYHDGSMVEDLAGVDVLRIFEFDNTRQTMTVVVREQGTGTIRCYIKGTYERIGDVCIDGRPVDYLDVAQAHAKRGMYVLALATRILDVNTSIDSLTRNELEKDATLCTLLLFRNEIKPDTPEAMRQICEGRIRPVIITGDNAFTAIAVAKRINIIRSSPQAATSLMQHTDEHFTRQISAGFLIDSEIASQSGTHTGHPILLGDVEDSVLVWRDVDTNEVIDSSRVYNSEVYRELAVTAAGFEYLLDTTNDEISEYWNHEEDCDFTRSSSIGSTSSMSITPRHKGRTKKMRSYPSLLDKVLSRIRIFASITPHGKVAVVKQFMQRGFVTGMCGDGCNDCGALRAAHAGIALSESEASLLSPFSAKSQKCTVVPELLREGRGSLVTSMACYKFYIMYGLLVSSVRVALLWFSGANMPDFDFLTLDCVLLLLYAQCMTLAKPRRRLSARSPTSSLFDPSTIISVMSMFVFNMIGLAATYAILRIWAQIPSPKSWNEMYQKQEWWVHGDNFDTSAVFLWCSFQFVNAGLIFTFGGVFRRNAFRNISFTSFWIGLNCILLYLLFGGPSLFHCMFRINCDDYHSRLLNNPILRLIAFCGNGLPFHSFDGNNIFSTGLKFAILIIAAVNGICNIVFHKLVIEGYPSQYYRSKYTDKSKHLLI